MLVGKGGVLKKMAQTKCRSSSARDLEESRRKLRDALEVRANGLALPREKDLDRILRYETANERQLNRALNRLERLQRLRKGEYVPAPLSVSLEGPLNGNSEN